VNKKKQAAAIAAACFFAFAIVYTLKVRHYVSAFTV